MPDINPLPDNAGTDAQVLLANDARNRAIRTFAQGLGIDVLVAVVIFLGPLVTSWNSIEDIQGEIVLFTLAKTIVSTVLSYLIRRFGDKTSLPTFKPPVITGSQANPALTGNDEPYDPAR